MPTLSPNLLTAPFREVVEEHACPYGERIIRSDKLRSLGARGLNTLELSLLTDELARLHADDTCPPTHVGNSPTKEWSDWVRATKV